MSDMPERVYVKLNNGYKPAMLQCDESPLGGGWEYIRADLVPTQTPDTEPPLSVRDQVALQCLQAIISNPMNRSNDDGQMFCLTAYNAADAFLSYRKGGG